MGILGPHIATGADARQLVGACYFGPLGERSFGGNPGTDYNAGIPDKAAYVALSLKMRRGFVGNQEVRVAVNSRNCH